VQESAEPVRLSWQQFVLPVAIVLAGMFLNVYRIDWQSLWANEAFSVSAASRPLAELRDILIGDVVHPPLHPFLLHVWMRVFGAGSLQARLLSAAFGTLSIGMMFLLGRRLFDRRTGLLASALLAVSQISVAYNQEARPYAQVLLLVICSAYLLVRALEERSAPLWWAFVAATAAMLYTHYYSVVAAGVMYGYAFVCRKKYELPLSRWAVGGLLMAALLAPWLAGGVVMEALQSPKIMPARLGPWFEVHWWTAATTINRFNDGYYFGVDFGTKWWNYLAGAVLICLPAALALKPLLRRGPDATEKERLLFVSALFAIPLAAALAAGAAFHVQYHPRYMMFVAAPYYLLVARGVMSLESPAWRRVLIVAVILYGLGSLRAVYFIPYKEDYRGALGEVARGYREGDCVTFVSGGLPLQWSIYYGDPSRLRIVTVEAAQHGGVTCRRIWAVSYRRAENMSAIADAELRKVQTQYTQREVKHYFGVDVQLFERNSSAALHAPSPLPSGSAGRNSKRGRERGVGALVLRIASSTAVL
jgi:4-amino-4-deoxy-L-arabinose transferase-like glycosyltransferase